MTTSSTTSSCCTTSRQVQSGALLGRAQVHLGHLRVDGLLHGGGALDAVLADGVAVGGRRRRRLGRRKAARVVDVLAQFGATYSTTSSSHSIPSAWNGQIDGFNAKLQPQLGGEQAAYQAVHWIGANLAGVCLQKKK